KLGKLPQLDQGAGRVVVKVPFSQGPQACEARVVYGQEIEVANARPHGAKLARQNRGATIGSRSTALPSQAPRGRRRTGRSLEATDSPPRINHISRPGCEIDAMHQEGADERTVNIRLSSPA